MVALEGSREAPRVLLRRRLELRDRGISGSAQTYHAAAEMEFAAAEEFLARCRESTHALALEAVRSALEDIARKGCEVAGGCVLLGSGRAVTDLKTILRSHPMLHTAEAEFYRDALRAACLACGIAACGVKEKTLAEEASKVLAMPVDELDQRVLELGKLIGPPWRQDEKLSAMGAWIVLAGKS